MKQSILQHNPKSKVLEPGYINIYSELNSKEKRQIFFKSLYKQVNPDWDETQVFLAKNFSKLVPIDSIILDAGCGNGNFVIDENRRKIAWAAGIDVAETCFANNICLDEINVGTLENLPYANDYYDAVISLWVLEHLESPEQVFSEVHRVLKPGGIFMLATPYKYFYPLLLINLINILGLNTLINKNLFGREEKDIFKTYYKVNTLWDIKELSKTGFETLTLKYNYDPSYTSFNKLTFKISNFLHRVLSSIGITVANAHIIGILKKV